MGKIVFKISPISYSLKDYKASFKGLYKQYQEIYKYSNLTDFISNEIRRYKLYKRNCEEYYKFLDLEVAFREQREAHKNDSESDLIYNENQYKGIVKDQEFYKQKLKGYPKGNESDLIIEVMEKAYSDNVVRQNLIFSFRNIIEYLTEYKSNLDSDNKREKEEAQIDLSDSNIPVKLIYLHELGVLEFLREKYKNYNVNQLSSVVSGITGEKQTTLVSYLNAIFNDSDPSKSPYHNKKNLEKVNSNLIRVGFYDSKK